MASVFTHAAVGLALGKVTTERSMPKRFWWLCAACSCFPDADVIGFAFGIRYGDLWGHRGLTHSLLFALVFGVAVTALAFREEKPFSPLWWRLVGCFAVVTASHGVLDAMTNGGLGIGFLSPFDPTRYFFPFRPVAVSPIGVSSFFSAWGLRVILSELVWIWLPTLALLVGVHWVRRRSEGEVEV